MCEETDPPIPIAEPGAQTLLWITGCCCGAAHPASPPADSIAWYLLEQSGEPGAAQALLDRSRRG